MTTPSGTTRHQVLAVETENNGREETDADFDFLSQQPGYKRRAAPFVWLFRVCVAALLLILFILLIVDLSHKNGGDDEDDGGRNEDDDGRDKDIAPEMSFENSGCMYAIGGGITKKGSGLSQPQTRSPECVRLFREYFKEGGQYWKETEEAIEDARVVFKEYDGEYEQMVILDIDETALSNLPINLEKDFDISRDELDEWMQEGIAPAINATREFYENLRKQGFSVAFVTGRHERHRRATVQNLVRAGYGRRCRRRPAEEGQMCYHELVMREDDDNRDAVLYKEEERKRLSRSGFELVASVGDQWSDLVGKNRPDIIIKMPNPFYYVP